MPRLTQAVPKYRKHRASGQAIVTIAGQDHYLGKYASKSSRMLYDRLIAEYLACNRNPVAHTMEAGITVVEVLAEFWRHAKSYYVKDGHPTTEQDAYRVIIRDVRRLYGDAEATQFGPKALKAVRQVWLERGQKRSTINNNVRKLIRIFRWAAAEEMVPASIYDALRTVAGLRKGRSGAAESTPVLAVPLEIVRQTAEHLSPILRDMIWLQLLTGMRPSEVCNLRPSDVNREDDVWEYSPASHKTDHHGRKRIVCMGPEAQALLAPYLERDADSYCFSPEENVREWKAEKHANRVTPLSCGNRPGSRERKNGKRTPRRKYDSSSYRRAVHRACDRAFQPPAQLAKREGESQRSWYDRLGADGVSALKQWQSEQRWSPNRLRHTAATNIRREFGLEAAQVILGHAAADVTQVYAERDQQKAKEVARQIG